jgi:hypothetical protein
MHDTHATPPPLLALLCHWGPRWQTDMPAARAAMFTAYAALLDPAAPAGV